MRISQLILLLCTLSGCQGLTQRVAPEQALKQIFSKRLSPLGALVDDRRVIEVDRNRLRFEEDGQARELDLADIALVNVDLRRQNPRPYEIIRIELEKDAPSVLSSGARVRTLGMGHKVIVLGDRPIGSGARLRGALAAFALARREHGEQSPKAPEPSVHKTSKAKTQLDRPGLDQLEAALERLERWHQRGLINKQEYDAKRQDLLKRM